MILSKILNVCERFEKLNEFFVLGLNGKLVVFI